MFVFVREAVPRGPAALTHTAFTTEDAPGGDSGGGGGGLSTACVIPQSYTQLLIHCEAARRWEVEGPSDLEADRVFGAVI